MANVADEMTAEVNLPPQPSSWSHVCTPRTPQTPTRATDTGYRPEAEKYRKHWSRQGFQLISDSSGPVRGCSRLAGAPHTNRNSRKPDSRPTGSPKPAFEQTRRRIPQNHLGNRKHPPSPQVRRLPWAHPPRHRPRARFVGLTQTEERVETSTCVIIKGLLPRFWGGH